MSPARLGPKRRQVADTTLAGGTPAVTGQGGLEVARANLWHGRAEEAHGAGRRLQLPPTTSWPPISPCFHPRLCHGAGGPTSSALRQSYSRRGEMWGDAGRCGEMWRDTCTPTSMLEIWGDMGRDVGRESASSPTRRYGEIWGDMGRSASSPTSPSLGPRSVKLQA